MEPPASCLHQGEGGSGLDKRHLPHFSPHSSYGKLQEAQASAASSRDSGAVFARSEERTGQDDPDRISLESGIYPPLSKPTIAVIFIVEFPMRDQPQLWWLVLLGLLTIGGCAGTGKVPTPCSHQEMLRPSSLDAALRRWFGGGACTTRAALSTSFFFMRTNAFTTPAIALLPRAPINGSPVPWLTSLYSKSWRGDYGDA